MMMTRRWTWTTVLTPLVRTRRGPVGGSYEQASAACQGMAVSLNAPVHPEIDGQPCPRLECSEGLYILA